MPFFENLVDQRGATYGDDDPASPYRYELWRVWDKARPILVFIMLNPSKANHLINDPTIGRCIDFAQRMGFGGIRVVNLYAFRATKPQQLFTVDDPVGPRNDEFIRRNVLNVHKAGGSVVAAWGNPQRFPRGRKPSIRHRDRYVIELIKDAGVPLHVLSFTDKNQPRHPLYTQKHETLKRWVSLYD